MTPGTTTTDGAVCAACGERGEPGDRFCEGCGAALPATEGPPPAEREGTRARPVTARASSPTPASPESPGPDADVPQQTDDHDPGHAAVGRPCASCGEGTIADDGFCDDCGRPAPDATGSAGGPATAAQVMASDPGDLGYDPDDRDHAERSVEGAAAITDVGRLRAANEDAFGLDRLPLAEGGPDLVVGVVCDGVASVPGSAAASAVACATVLATARDAVAHPDPADPDLADTGGVDLTELAYVCADAAVDAVSALAHAGRDSPACTYVSSLVVGDVLVVSWIGDSRAYWLVPDEPEHSCVLTTDDSWAAEAVAVGLLDPETAYADRRAHAITRWVAADGPPGPAHVVAHAADRPGVLLICSDGLWNHIPDAADLARLVHDDGLPATAEAMLEAALDDGGTDNTTLVVVDVAGEGIPA
ncbi:protein phosphatase 2C domain-containing protein [Actinomycetospora endophytica]|uniref:Protein phosphatase 2C domain-containing protein n=1 Tax=Actinomycetospora endophytica TaxID=2291215 RepID=A0ABS8PCA4_9PSEU|nr:protein phosphatase 2C domain-containing protein [Actinomycetospora endophytica]MCD2195921.1 protein phosphatase 2C domain-containing protein [Actinomycetospora endophytica]